MKNKKRIHIRIKASDNHQDSKKIIAGKASKLGLKGYLSTREDVLEIVAEGERNSVFELVRECTSKKLKTKVKEVLFYFADHKDEFTSFSLN